MAKGMLELIQTADRDNDVLVDVCEWLVKEPLRDQFIEHPRSLWLIWNYLKRFGLRTTINKVISRLSEVKRNKKVAGLLVGKIIRKPIDCHIAERDLVLCFAYNHDSQADILVLDRRFVYPISKTCLGSRKKLSSLPLELSDYKAWNRFSGEQLDQVLLASLLSNIAKSISIDRLTFESPTRKHTEVLERVPILNRKPTGVLFGLGNYAKTAILPNIKGNINLQRVHEIDPEQLSYLSSYKNISLDTSAVPRKGLRFDAWFIAGFHHTHSALAISALEQGACAVIEKPLVTSITQYNQLLRSIEKNKNSRFYSCFHKRYSKLNDFFYRDMVSNESCPIDMHCVVYEIPLPKYHWYNWSNSGSRLISNGCHWLDYFMFLNGYSDVVDIRKWNPRDSDMVVQVSLKNDAYLAMSLTDSGSQRLGVRDHIELRAAGNTFTMIDGTYYAAENRNRVYAKHRVNPVTSYANMYSNISKKIARREAGDDIVTLKSTKLMLDLESLS
jgi:hypothetical protein